MEILGVDIGGTGMKAAIVDTKTGELKSGRRRIPTPQPADMENMAGVMRQLVDHFEWKGKVGCGFPAAMRRGVALTASNIDRNWIGQNVEDLFKSATGLKFKVVNDADAAGLAEVKFGAGKGRKGLSLLLTIGTGIGSALIVDGKLIPNTELGHLLLHGDIAERYASNAARKNEELGWVRWGGRLNEYLRHVEKLFYPDLIILGGGISKRFDDFQHLLHTETKVVPAKLKNHAGIIGAALSAV